MTDEARRQDALTAFEPQRRRLFGIAYRMLGSVSEAEDVVQDAWLRWQGADRASVREPAAFLATTVTRLCLNALSSARARRELYVGPWLPEPVSTTDDPTLGAERAEALSLAVLLLMERLTPAERAAYVLREAFVYSHRDIAAVLETTETNARQLVSRARAHVTAERAAPVEPGARDRLLGAFLTAAQAGDLVGLEAVLSGDVLALADGGGRVTAARKSVRGRVRTAGYLLGVLAKFGRGVEAVPIEVNDEQAVLGARDGSPVGIWSVEIAPDGVRRVLIVLNPDKLERFAAAALSRS
ncbi:MAG TPA: RNA polymerase sigma-70 factor [Cellulomonas sp.]